MLRLMFVPLVLFISLLLTAIVIWIIYKKIKRGFNYSVKKGAEIANEHQQKWTEKGQRKKLPKILRKGFDDYEKIMSISDTLPEQWNQLIDPIATSAKEILDEVAFEFSSSENKQQPLQNKIQNKKLNSIRPFFIHSLDALLQFVEKLNSDHKTMNADEIEKARENSQIFKADLQSHQQTLHKVRRFDFDVVMDVIKARLKR